MTRRVERVAACLVVLLAHALLLWAWRLVAPPAPRERSPGAAPSVTLLRLVPAAPATPPAQVAHETRTPMTATTATRPIKTLPPRLEETAAAASHGAPALATPEPQASAPVATPRALELSAPRATTAAPAQRTMKDQLLNDPRANTPRASIEARIAALTGPDRWEAEPMDATRTRFRRNGECIEVHVARNAQIDPWNQSHSPTPKAVKPDC